MQSTPSLPSLPGPLLLGVVASDRVLFIARIELNWIAWNRSVLTFKIRSWINWIDCYRTVVDIETGLKLNWIVWNRTILTKIILILHWIVWNETVWRD